MDCVAAEKNINSFIRGTLKGNNLRRTYYHLKKCERCKEVLLDEFSFYITFNDLDKDINFNFRKQLEKYMDKIEHNILASDKLKRQSYAFYSILICILLAILLVIAIRMVY